MEYIFRPDIMMMEGLICLCLYLMYQVHRKFGDSPANKV
ncbi:hypothetical protein LEP1GSC047_2234 [Leptospira inadai serovar Lyme str. 10]|uniref:Uncharacterized protein n=1 Tax=Leptospira inadai serovar Lyme str. 10 TaxID=1049790 RepID=V6HPB0_9LEPT|nr:hypothetical protein LEP1GSC047_2234 [Leptospira inadai serovar Lyme str. 10]